MFIKQKRVVNVEKYLSDLTDGQRFVLSVTVDETVLKKLPSMGWPAEPQNGDTVLPSVRGPVSRFNAEGGFTLRKDFPSFPIAQMFITRSPCLSALRKRRTWC